MEDKKNLTGYVNINDSSNYQLLYATQSYFSFFCVYAKFTIEKVLDNDGKETILLTSVNFHLRNYKGFTYEFKNVKPDLIIYNDGVLRIGFDFTMHGGLRRNAEVNENIDITGIKHIFFSSDPSNFEKIKTKNLKDLKNEYVNIQDYSNIREGNVLSNSFLNLIQELEDRINDSNLMKKIDILAVGDNCRVSLMEVTEG